MALADATITFDLNQLLGDDFDTRRTRAYVVTNVENDTLMDTSTGEIRMGDQKVTIAADGTGSWTTWIPGVDGNPVSWQETLVVEYARTGQRDRQVRRFGPYTIAASADLTALEEEQAVPAEYLTTVTTTLDTYVTEAEAARDATVDISNISTSDAVVEALVLNTGGAGPLTSGALSDTYAAKVNNARATDLVPAAGGSIFVPPAALSPGSVGAAWYTANKGLGDVFRVDAPTLARYINIRIGGGTGNYQVYLGRLNAARTSIYVLGASAITAASGTAAHVRVDLGENILMVPGDYAVFLWCSATTMLANHGINNDHGATRSSVEINGVQAGGVTTGTTLTGNPATGRWITHVSVSGPEPTAQVLSLLGDSITADSIWWTRGNSLAGLPFSGLHNHGVGGDTTAMMLARASTALSMSPDVLHVMGGTNDIGQDVPTATTIANLTAIYDQAVAAGATLIRYTVPPRDTNASRRALWHAINDWLRNTAQDWPGLFIDWTPALADPDGDGSDMNLALFADTVHPNDAGRRAMSDYWATRVSAEVQTKGLIV